MMDCPPEEVVPMGLSPAVLADRYKVKPDPWCPKINPEFDPYCDPDNPKTISYKRIVKAALLIKPEFNKTPLKSLSHYAKKFGVPLTIVFPKEVNYLITQQCEENGATIFFEGYTLEEAKKKALNIATETGIVYLDGNDHPRVVAACGSIGLEIMSQLPKVDAILIPVGSGGLIAGIAVAAKRVNPNVLIYGVEPYKSCSFLKAVENERPYVTHVCKNNVASSLAAPKAGCNAYHTCISLLDKIILVDEDTIARAVMHLANEEKVVVEGAGAVGLAALMAVPFTLPELLEKTVVCVITGSNVAATVLIDTINRGRAAEGAIIRVKASLDADNTGELAKLLRIIRNLDIDILSQDVQPGWIVEDCYNKVDFWITCQTKNLRHACTLRRVLEKLFPGVCEFDSEPFGPLPICACLSKRY